MAPVLLCFVMFTLLGSVRVWSAWSTVDNSKNHEGAQNFHSLPSGVCAAVIHFAGSATFAIAHTNTQNYSLTWRPGPPKHSHSQCSGSSSGSTSSMQTVFPIGARGLLSSLAQHKQELFCRARSSWWWRLKCFLRTYFCAPLKDGQFWRRFAMLQFCCFPLYAADINTAVSCARLKTNWPCLNLC